jgi:molybdate transport system ATP-binding protein
VTLDADLRVVRGEFSLGIRLAVEPGVVVALVGPNGAG